jgi:DNA-binding CsgD family transcriptional regulator
MFHSYAGQSMKNYNAVNLTNREREVLKLLVEGASNEKIAQSLYISVATVKAHLTGIFEKLGVKSRTLAIVKALKLGIV